MTYLESVRDQYEDLPYPLRHPQDEKARLCVTLHDILEQLNHYGFGGRQNFSNGFRALIAGGGTGDAVIMLAEQLRGTHAEIIYADISLQSMKIAQERAAMRGLTGITWLHASLLDLPEIGMFDYINCSGVLHHLADPDAGLLALKSRLKPDGVMGLMVYSAVGRVGVYHMQALLRSLTKHISSKAEKLLITKKLLSDLPKTNWFIRGYDIFEAGLNTQGENELYDLFLHTQDRAYTVSELYAWLDRCDLNLLDFLMPNGLGKIAYDPGMYLKSPEIKQEFGKLPLRERQAAAELISGKMIMHSFYAAAKPIAHPSATDLEMVPFLSNHFAPSPEQGYAYLRDSFAKANLQERVHIVQPGTTNAMRIPKNRFTQKLLEALDGIKTVGELLDAVWSQYASMPDAPPREQLLQEWKQLYEYLNYYDWVFLRHCSVLPFPRLPELQQRMQDSMKQAV